MSSHKYLNNLQLLAAGLIKYAWSILATKIKGSILWFIALYFYCYVVVSHRKIHKILA